VGPALGLEAAEDEDVDGVYAGVRYRQGAHEVLVVH
jgi:hypothetical protein